MHGAMYRQHKTGMDSVQGIISSMEETGIRTIRLGATQRFKEASAAADESVPGGTTRLAMVEADSAVETGAPTMDVVLSKYYTHTSNCMSFGIIVAHATISKDLYHASCCMLLELHARSTIKPLMILLCCLLRFKTALH